MTNFDARKNICSAITTVHADPAEWLKAARTFAELLGLDPARCLVLGQPLDIVIDGIMSEGRKQGRTLEQMVAAAPR